MARYSAEELATRAFKRHLAAKEAKKANSAKKPENVLQIITPRMQVIINAMPFGWLHKLDLPALHAYTLAQNAYEVFMDRFLMGERVPEGWRTVKAMGDEMRAWAKVLGFGSTRTRHDISLQGKQRVKVGASPDMAQLEESLEEREGGMGADSGDDDLFVDLTG